LISDSPAVQEIWIFRLPCSAGDLDFQTPLQCRRFGVDFRLLCSAGDLELIFRLHCNAGDLELISDSPAVQEIWS